MLRASCGVSFRSSFTSLFHRTMSYSYRSAADLLAEEKKFVFFTPSELEAKGDEPPAARDPNEFELFHNNISHSSQRVWIVLKHHNIPHRLIRIPIGEEGKKSKPAWYSKLNPSGNVPTLRRGEDVVVDSVSCKCSFASQPHNTTSLATGCCGGVRRHVWRKS